MQTANGWWKSSPIHPPLISSTRAAKGPRNSKSNFVSSRKDAPPIPPQTSLDHVDAAPPVSGTLAGAIVALGKFDALHIGHRALAEQASRMGGIPVLLSFAGMREILGWEKRLPLVAPCDRRRVMSLWASYCRGQTPDEYSLDFRIIRHLSPQEFVNKLAVELQVKGVVAGRNYRFGYKASGDAGELERLCSERGLEVFVVEPVMDKFEQAPPCLDARDKGQVSSTRVRRALEEGKMKRVHELLGRRHRLVLASGAAAAAAAAKRGGDALRLPLSAALNQPPAQGWYPDCALAFQSGEATQGCNVRICGDEIVLQGVQVREEDDLMSVEF